jgi:hypothetical protein
MADEDFDFDIAVIGCDVGGHGAALHSRGQGCVPSKALLAASGRVREMRNADHLKRLGIEVEGEVMYSRQGIADHAKNLASRVKGSLEGSLLGLGCEVLEGRGVLTGQPHEVKDEATGKIYRAKVSEWLNKTRYLRNLPASTFLLPRSVPPYLYPPSIGYYPCYRFRALCSSRYRYYSRRENSLHLRWGSRAPVRFRVDCNHWLWLHRFGVFRRIQHGSWKRSYVYRGTPKPYFAHLR